MGEISYTYDKRSNLLTKTLPTGTNEYTYNVYNELLSSSNSNAEWSYSHDDVGRITNATLNINGLSYPVNYNYVLARLQNFNSPAGNVSYTYDDAERVTNIATSDGDNFGFTYSDLGEVKNKSRPNNVNEANTFDELGRLISISNTLSSNNLMSLVYGYDPEGNKLSEVLSFDVIASGSEVILGKLYKYDPLYRLRSVKKIDPSVYTEIPTFDNAPTFNEMTTLDLDILGNRKTVTIEDSAGAITELNKYNELGGIYTPDPTNKILTTNDTNNRLCIKSSAKIKEVMLNS